MEAILNSPLFGIVLCGATYSFGVWLNKKTGWVILNPFLIAMTICIVFLSITGISIDQFNNGARIVQLFLAPATAVIGVSIYRQRKVLKENFIPVVLGCSVSAIVSIGASFSLGYLFNLDEVIVASTVPSAVTSPIAMDIASNNGGIVSIAILCVVITGVSGAILAPYLVKFLKITDPVEIGVAIGASSHVVGTSKALEMGEVQGAMSGVAIGIAGLATVFLTLFI